jgi:hypothetical protein
LFQKGGTTIFFFQRWLDPTIICRYPVLTCWMILRSLPKYLCIFCLLQQKNRILHKLTNFGPLTSTQIVLSKFENVFMLTWFVWCKICIFLFFSITFFSVQLIQNYSKFKGSAILSKFQVWKNVGSLNLLIWTLEKILSFSKTF